jgi:hypothetical protein
MRPLFLALPIIMLPTVYPAAQTGLPFDRYQYSTPTYGLAKVQSAIQKMGDFRYGRTYALSENEYNSLTLDEKFTYNMIHQESYSQMCSSLPFQDSGATRIYGNLPWSPREYSWSTRQRDFFKNNRDSVERLIKEVISKDGSAGSNLLTVIVDIKAKDLIPLLIATYRRYPVNHYILTTLMLLMNDNNYPTFMDSQQHKRLYNPRQRAEAGSADYLPYTTANIDFILQQAANFYHDTVRH